MKKVLIICLFVLGLIIPNIDVKAVNVSNEEELRAAIEQGGDITLTKDIEVKEPLVIDKDVNISGRGIMMQGDNTLMTVNSGNVTLDVDLIAGWNGQYDEWGNPNNVIKNQGIALEINGGTVNFENTSVGAGKVVIEINGGTVTGTSGIIAGEYNENNETYSGGQGMIVNSGNVDLDIPYIYSGGTALTVNNGSNVTLDGAQINSYEGNGIEENHGANLTLTDAYDNLFINSYEENGIEVNDGSVVNINSIRLSSIIFGSKNAIYLNGGTANVDSDIKLYSPQNLFKFSKGKNNNIPSITLNGDIYIDAGYNPWPINGGISFDSDISEIKIQNNNTNTPFYYDDEKLKINAKYSEGTYTLQSNSISCINAININGKKNTIDWCLASNENELRNYIANNKNIRLTSDITLTSPLDIKNKNLTIDGDGWAIRQNYEALFSVSGGNVTLKNTWFIGLGQMEIKDGAVVTYDNMETSDNPSTVVLNGGTLKIKEVRLYKDFNINIKKGVNDKTGDSVLIFENIEPVQSWYNSNLNINVDSSVRELRLTNDENINNKISLDGKNLLIALLSKPDDTVKTMSSNDLDCINVIIDGKETYVGNKNACKPEPSEIVNVPSTSLYGSVAIIILGIICIGISIYVTRKITTK